MKLLKSHRDQKSRPYVYKALQFGCTVLEIDVQKAGGELVLGHNWRPAIPFLFDCTFDQYMHRVESAKRTATIFLQIDIKEICFTKKQMTDFARLIVRQLKPFKDIVTPIVSANAGLNRLKTLDAVYDEMIKAGFNASLNCEWIKDKEITTQDLW